MSGTWSTVDSLPVSPASGDGVAAMTVDTAGNVYAAGAYNGSAILREKPTGSTGFVTVPVNSSAGSFLAFDSILIDASGNLFLGATDASGYARTVLERPASQANFAPLNVTVPSGAQLLSIGGVAQSIAADSAGDVFAFGQIRTTTTTKRGTVYTDYGALFEMPAGQSNFTPVYTSTSFRPVEMTDVGSGPSAGIYVIEDGTWKVDKSTDGGASWTTVDSYNYDPNNLHETFAWALVSDSTGNGNVFVAGQGQRKVITGYKTVKVNGKLVQQPIYGFENHWLTRQSSDGGVTWTTVDDFDLSPMPGNENAPIAAADLAGTVYVGGTSSDSSGSLYSVIRTNAGGAWSTSDDDANGDGYEAVAIDPTTGTPYGSTDQGSTWTIRSGPAPASSSSISSAVSTAFSSTLLTTSDATSSGSGTSWLKTT
jgi:hypothetical protein